MTNLEKYIIARWCYAIGEDYIDDIEYRCLDEEMKQQYPDNEYVNRSWSDDPCPIELLEKFNLMQYYRDIKFAYKSESIRSINSEDEFKIQFSDLNERSRVSYKEDGFNIQVNYYNGKPISADTRGRTGNSLNANTLLQIVPKSIPMMGKVKITGECIIPNDKWKEFQQEFSNTSQRSSVSTCLANGLGYYLEYRAFDIKIEEGKIEGDVYKLLDEWGFKTPYFMWVENFAQLQKVVKMMGIRNKVCNNPTDGLVIENSRYQLAIRIGEWQEAVLKSYVTGYAESKGKYSNPMRVNIAPVKSKEGSTYSTVGVTNIQYILDCELKIGSPIAFDLRSMSTPVLNATVTERLQTEWDGRFDEYRSMIDADREDVNEQI